jgi:hypothetical protein
VRFLVVALTMVCTCSVLVGQTGTNQRRLALANRWGSVPSVPDFLTLGSQDDSDEPVSALSNYYRAINAKDYKGAYSYWEAPSQTIDQFTRGFADTASVRLLMDPAPQIEGAAGSSYANVSIILISRSTSDGERYFAGCYVLRKSNVESDNAPPRQGWRIYKATIAAATAKATLSTVLSHTCKE